MGKRSEGRWFYKPVLYVVLFPKAHYCFGAVLLPGPHDTVPPFITRSRGKGCGGGGGRLWIHT